MAFQAARKAQKRCRTYSFPGDTEEQSEVPSSAKPTASEEEGLLSEEARLQKLFGDDIEANEIILATIDALERRELKVRKPDPKFFDGLQYVLDTYPHLAGGVRIVLDSPWEAFAENIYFMPSVLSLLINHSKLETLTLQNFDPESLVAVITSSLGRQTALKELNLQDNSLTTPDLLYALRSLPWPPRDWFSISTATT